MQEQPFDLKTFIYQYLLRYWYLYLFFLSGALFLAWLKIRYTTPIYQIRSTLLIEDEQSKSTFVTEEAIFRDLGLIQGGPRVLNEIQILKSKPLMTAVVEKLGLDVEYYTVGRVRTSESYPYGPLYAGLHEVSEQGYNQPFLFNIIDSQYFNLTLSGNTSKHQFGELLELPQGKFMFTLRGVPNLENQYKIIFRQPAAIAGGYAGSLSLNLINNYSSVVEMTFKGPVPAKGADILNTLVDVYNESTIDAKNLVGKNTIRFIDERLIYLTAELSDVEGALEQYKRRNNIPSEISSSVDILVEQLDAAGDNLSQLEIQNSLLIALQAFIGNQLNAHEPAPVNLLPDKQPVAQLVDRYNTLLLERGRLLRSATPENPVVQNIDSQIAVLRNTILETIGQNLRDLQTQQRLGELKNAQYIQQIGALPQKERGLIEIKRQQGIKESLFLYLLQKREETALALAVAVPGSRSVDPASPDGIPISPNKRSIYLMALLVGLLIPSSLVYLRSLLTTSVQSESEITSLTGVPILGSIGYQKGTEPVVVKAGSRSALSEMFRLLRTNLQFLNAGRPNQVILVTSSVSGEGKSFVTLNLGLTMALTDKKTVILELDLRRPKLMRYLQQNEDRSTGITTFLIGQNTLDEIVKPSVIHPNLYAISGGPLPPNPGELLLTEALERLIAELRTKFDFILLDTPPVGMVADALLLGRLADSAIYIVRHNQTQKSSLSILEEIKREQKLPHVAAVMNAVKVQGHYGYYRKYGYSYGYYEDVKARAPWWKRWF